MALHLCDKAIHSRFDKCSEPKLFCYVRAGIDLHAFDLCVFIITLTGERVVALFNYESRNAGDLSFLKSEEFHVLKAT